MPRAKKASIGSGISNSGSSAKFMDLAYHPGGSSSRRVPNDATEIASSNSGPSSSIESVDCERTSAGTPTDKPPKGAIRSSSRLRNQRSKMASNTSKTPENRPSLYNLNTESSTASSAKSMFDHSPGQSGDDLASPLTPRDDSPDPKTQNLPSSPPKYSDESPLRNKVERNSRKKHQNFNVITINLKPSAKTDGSLERETSLEYGTAKMTLDSSENQDSPAVQSDRTGMTVDKGIRTSPVVLDLENTEARSDYFGVDHARDSDVHMNDAIDIDSDLGEDVTEVDTSTEASGCNSSVDDYEQTDNSYPIKQSIESDNDDHERSDSEQETDLESEDAEVLLEKFQLDNCLPPADNPSVGSGTPQSMPPKFKKMFLECLERSEVCQMLHDRLEIGVAPESAKNPPKLGYVYLYKLDYGPSPPPECHYIKIGKTEKEVITRINYWKKQCGLPNAHIIDPYHEKFRHYSMAERLVHLELRIERFTHKCERCKKKKKKKTKAMSLDFMESGSTSAKIRHCRLYKSGGGLSWRANRSKPTGS